MTEYTARILTLRYAPPRMVTIDYSIDEMEISSAIMMPLDSVTIEEVTNKLQHEIPKKLADPGHAAFMEAAKNLVGRELKINFLSADKTLTKTDDDDDDDKEETQ